MIWVWTFIKHVLPYPPPPAPCVWVALKQCKVSQSLCAGSSIATNGKELSVVSLTRGSLPSLVVRGYEQPECTGASSRSESVRYRHCLVCGGDFPCPSHVYSLLSCTITLFDVIDVLRGANSGGERQTHIKEKTGLGLGSLDSLVSNFCKAYGQPRGSHIRIQPNPRGRYVGGRRFQKVPESSRWMCHMPSTALSLWKWRGCWVYPSAPSSSTGLTVVLSHYVICVMCS